MPMMEGGLQIQRSSKAARILQQRLRDHESAKKQFENSIKAIDRSIAKVPEYRAKYFHAKHAEDKYNARQFESGEKAVKVEDKKNKESAKLLKSLKNSNKAAEGSSKEDRGLGD